MANADHTTLSSKTLSAPNPISTVYKSLLFFDNVANSVRYTDGIDLFDIEVNSISNPLTFTGDILIGNLSGNLQSDPASTPVIGGSVSQMFNDIYAGDPQAVNLVTYNTGAGTTQDGDTGVTDIAKNRGIIWGLKEEQRLRLEQVTEINVELTELEGIAFGQSWIS